MTQHQKITLEEYFELGAPFHLALGVLGLENFQQSLDARFTWLRWRREEDDWGFHSF